MMQSEYALVIGALGLFLAMLAGFALGHRLRKGIEDEDKARGIGAIEGAVFALFGLVLAFAFSAAWDRLEDRRKMVVEEANAIKSAYMKLDLLTPSHAAAMRIQMRDYTENRLLIYRSTHDEEVLVQAENRSNELEAAIWKTFTDTSEPLGPSLLLVPALTQMFDLGTARTVALGTHTPWLITAFLVLLALLSSVLAGRALAGPRDGWFHRLIFAAVVSVTVYVVTDLDHPRTGLIRVGPADEAMQALRPLMNP